MEFSRHKIPTLIVAGDADFVVPIDENTRPFADRVNRRGGSVRVIEQSGLGHMESELKDSNEGVEFFMAAWMKSRPQTQSAGEGSG